MSSNVPTVKRLRYAIGYLALGLIDEASDELEAIEGEDRLSLEVIELRVELYSVAEHWDMVINMAKAATEAPTKKAQVWLSWAVALRQLSRVEEARDVLLKAEPEHGPTCPTLHLDLARYLFLLGERDKALHRLKIALEQNPDLIDQARADADLNELLDPRIR